MTTTIEIIEELEIQANSRAGQELDVFWEAAQRLRELDKQLSEMQPAYPKGQVIGSCVCGGWPGGECLKCEWIPSKDGAVKEST